MVRTQTRLLVDWEGNGLFAGANDDVTARLFAAPPVTCSRGRNLASQLTGKSIAGRLAAVLNNTSGDYSAFNTSSPIAGKMLPGRRVRLLAGQWALSFDGDGDYVDVGDITELDAAATVTWECWLRVSSLAAERVYCSRWSGANQQFKLSISTDGRVAVALDGGLRGRTAAGVIAANTWYHVAVVFDGTQTGDANRQKIYVGGVSQALTFTNAVPAALPTVTGDVHIGQQSDDTLEFAGDLDEVRIWSDARTEAEVQDNQHARLDGDEAGLLGYWRIEEGSGATIADATASGYDGTIINALWTRVFRADSYAEAPQWSGFLRQITERFRAGGRKEAVLEAIGALGYLNRREVRVPMVTSIGTGDAIDDILDAAGWAAGDRDVDAGQTTMSRFWSSEVLTLTALRKVEETEAGFIAEARDGKIAFEGRHHRLTSPHTVSQGTFSDAVGATHPYRQGSPASPLPNIYNIFEARVQRHTVGSLAVLWTLSESGADSPFIEPGASKAFWASYPNPVSGSDAVAADAWTTPVENTDYEANTQADGGGSDISADIVVAVSKFPTSMKITLTNNNAARAYITLLQARGTPVTADDPVMVSAEDATSQAAYGERTYPSPGEFIPDTGEAQDWCDLSLSIYKDELPIVPLELIVSRSEELLTKALELDVSDRVTLVGTGASGSGISEDFFIEAVHHRIAQAGFEHTMVLDLSPASGFSGFWTVGVTPASFEMKLAY